MGYISFTITNPTGINNSVRKSNSRSRGRVLCIGLSRGGVLMRSPKCRNSVFCVQFLIFFLLGTICGIWFYRCLAELETVWLEPYCSLLTGASGWSALFSAVRPLIAAWLVWFCPEGYRILPLLIGMRGCLTAYTACAVLRAGLPSGPVILRGLVILPLFYWLCRRAFCRRYTEAVASEREHIVRGKNYGSCIRIL